MLLIVPPFTGGQISFCENLFVGYSEFRTANGLLTSSPHLAPHYNEHTSATNPASLSVTDSKAICQEGVGDL